MAGRQLDPMAREFTADHQVTAVIEIGIAEEQRSGEIAPHPFR